MLERIIGVGIALVGLSGCFMIQGHAEMVKRDKSGGVLALKGDRDKAMADAKNQMASACPGGYEIVGEEMVKVGEKTEGVEDSHYEKGSNEKSHESMTSDVKEYRITYECSGGGGDETSGGEEEAPAEDAEI